MKAKGLIFAAAATLLSATPSFAVVPNLLGLPIGGLSIAIAATKADLAAVEQSAKAAQGSIRASPADAKAFAGAVKAKDERKVRALLEKHGFSARQLEGAKIVLRDATGGGEAQKTKVTIEASCCPLTITITIHL
jgi:hypothetical protein